jgi:hypothetical protein
MIDNGLKKELIELNLQMGDAEMNHEREFFNKVLHSNLQFRRANKEGSIVTKQEFLDDMKEGHVTHDFLDIPPQSIDVDVYEDTAVVLLLVRARGHRLVNGSEPEPWQGIYHNTRIFLKESDEWQCAFWFNTRISDLTDE